MSPAEPRLRCATEPRLRWFDWTTMAVLVVLVACLAGRGFVPPEACGPSGDCGCGDPHGCQLPCPSCCDGKCPCKDNPTEAK